MVQEEGEPAQGREVCQEARLLESDGKEKVRGSRDSKGYTGQGHHVSQEGSPGQRRPEWGPEGQAGVRGAEVRRGPSWKFLQSLDRKSVV